MQRNNLLAAGALSMPSLLLMDSTIKGTVFLILALLLVLFLRRDSAATRHLVWMLAIVALLAVPVFSLLLPQWRVLPEWANLAHEQAENPTEPAVHAKLDPGIFAAANDLEVIPFPGAVQSAGEPEKEPSLGFEKDGTADLPLGDWNWLNALPVIWSVGFVYLVARLVACARVLWRNEGAGEWIGISGDTQAEGIDLLLEELGSARRQMGIRMPIVLLLHPGKSIPVVWGIFRCRLMLPAVAREWGEDQLRSVLLHELAHVQRRDLLVQLLTQVACALYWFNPLVWVAAWRLSVERERACDDLVLASGVRPSAYAGHLLEVVSGASRFYGTQSLGLAMAQPTTLEGRLVAVLSGNLNRRRVSILWGVATLALVLAVAIPIAMLRAADEDWNPPTGAHVATNDFSTFCVHDGNQAAYVLAYQGYTGTSSTLDSNPKTKTWTDSGRIFAKNDKLQLAFHRSHIAPETLEIGVTEAIGPEIPKPIGLKAIGSRKFDLKRGRVFLLSGNGRVQQINIPVPVIRDLEAAGKMAAAVAALKLEELTGESISPKAVPMDKKAQALFAEWQTGARRDGKIPGGRIGEIGASLKTFLDLNPGHEKKPILEAMIRKCDSSRDWTGEAAAALLDEIAEVEPFRAEWTLFTLKERTIHPGKPLLDDLKQHAPWGLVAPNGLSLAWLLEPRAEKQPLDSVLKSRVLFRNSGKQVVFLATENWIQSGSHKALDPAEEFGKSGKEIPVWAVGRLGLRNRMVFRLAPGQYAEVEGHGIGIGSHKTASEKSINRVGCWIEAKEGDFVEFRPGKVPVSFQTWKNNEGRKDSLTVWNEYIGKLVERQGPMPGDARDREELLKRVYQELFGASPKEEETKSFLTDQGPDALGRLAKSLRERTRAMHFAGELESGFTRFRVTPKETKTGMGPNAGIPEGVTKNSEKSEPQKTGVLLKPETVAKLEWGPSVQGLRMALAWPPALDEPSLGQVPDFFLVVQNTENHPVRFRIHPEARDSRHLTIQSNGETLFRISTQETAGLDYLLEKGGAAIFKLFEMDPNKPSTSSMMAGIVRNDPKVTLVADLRISNAPQGDLMAKLVTGGTRAGAFVEGPKGRKANQVFKAWLHHARANGDIPGGCISCLGDRAKEFVAANRQDTAGRTYARKMEVLLPRLDSGKDMPLPEVAKLLDSVAAVSDAPLNVLLQEMAGSVLQNGAFLPKGWANAPWGKPSANGLRATVLVEPQGKEYRLGTGLKTRILIHNSGEKPVVFRTRSWHHIEPKAQNSQGQDIAVESMGRFTMAPLQIHLLQPGRYLELAAPGLGIGRRTFHDWKGADLATWLEAKAGEEVVLAPGSVPLGDWNEVTSAPGEAPWWMSILQARLKLASPLSRDDGERIQLIKQVVREYFQAEATREEIEAFVGDRGPDALDSLAKRLSQRQDVQVCNGPLVPGEIRFKVLPADPNSPYPPEAPASGR